MSIDSPVTLFDIKTSGETNITNCGLIVAHRGANGESGSNGYDATHKDGVAGGAGTNGAGIKAFSTETTIVVANEGILHSGNGGNGGAGGSSYSQDGLNGMTACESGENGAGGAAGTAGVLSGFSGNGSVAAAGLAGVEGAKARASFQGEIKTQQSLYNHGLIDPGLWLAAFTNIDDFIDTNFNHTVAWIGEEKLEMKKETVMEDGNDENLQYLAKIFKDAVGQILPEKDVWGN